MLVQVFIFSDMEVGDAKEVDRITGRLEGVLTARGVANLENEGLRIGEVTTDASSTFISYFGMYDYMHFFNIFPLLLNCACISQSNGMHFIYSYFHLGDLDIAKAVDSFLLCDLDHVVYNIYDKCRSLVCKAILFVLIIL